MNYPMQIRLDPVPAARTVTQAAVSLWSRLKERVAKWQRQRDAAAMSATLRTLDPRILRDLGMHVSEIDSVVAEITGHAERTRRQALQAPYYPHY